MNSDMRDQNGRREAGRETARDIVGFKTVDAMRISSARHPVVQLAQDAVLRLA